jgi:hypothetical protein
VWKFITFYATAISLIIGLGQKLATTTDAIIDIAVAASVAGLLSFWGLSIVIDSNSWMSRNLKLVGNIEKLFFPDNQYGQLLPIEYASPFYRHFRPYTIDFILLSALGAITFLNFIAHFPNSENDPRRYLLPLISLLYVLSFILIQGLDQRARREYVRFFFSARGKKIGSTLETLPQDYLEFKLAVGARFSQWAFLGSFFVTSVYLLKEQASLHRPLITGLLVVVSVVGLFFLALSIVFHKSIKGLAETAQVMDEPFLSTWKTSQAQRFYSVSTWICRWALLLVITVFTLIAYWEQLKSFFAFL